MLSPSKEGIEMLSAGSDGLDGPTDAAGAMVNGMTMAIAAGCGLDALAFLENNDSYTFFSELDRRGELTSDGKC
jgi:glycerate 2-kinase